MAKSLKLDVIAEGVETSRPLAEFRCLGVRLAQGFLWFRADGNLRESQPNIRSPSFRIFSTSTGGTQHELEWGSAPVTGLSFPMP